MPAPAAQYLTSAEALAYLANQGVRRSPVTLQKMHSDGRLPASAFDGRRRLYDLGTLNMYAARQLKTSNHKSRVST
jgi:hypothetical protein